MEKKYDLVIVGSGPAGLTAGIYAQRARLNTLVIEKEMVSGGQVLTTYEVENYPGFPWMDLRSERNSGSMRITSAQNLSPMRLWEFA